MNSVELDEEKLGYLAGFMDGEGCFYISPAPQYKVHVRCSNTYKPIIDELQRIFGGSVREDKKQKSHHKQCLVAKQAEDVCKTLLPYLKEKQSRAMACILIRQWSSQGVKATQEIKNERARIYERYNDEKRPKLVGSVLPRFSCIYGNSI